MGAATDMSERWGTRTKAPFRIAILLAGAAMTSGCATSSFAPPAVELDRPIVSPDPTKCAQLAPPSGPRLQHNVAGGVDLVDNFVRAYRCAAREAADGRQAFEVPSFLALAAAGLGPAFGMSEDAGLALGGAAAVAGHANSYYAPKQKAVVLDSALNAVLCVKTESVGVDFFDTRRDPDPVIESAIASTQQVLGTLNADVQKLSIERSAVQLEISGAAREMQIAPTPEGREAASQRQQQQRMRTAEIDTEIASKAQAVSAATNALVRLRSRELSSIVNPLIITRQLSGGGVVEVSVAEQYFQMVSAALLSVDRILAQRLSNTGSFDSAGLASELSTLIKKRDDAEAALNTAKDARDKAAATAGGGGGGGGAAVPMAMAPGEERANEKVIELSIGVLQPALQKCVVMAKL